jgi:hypothetical protein
MYLQSYLHSMYHRNYACVCGLKGLKLTETHRVNGKSIWDNLDITDFFIITDKPFFYRFLTFLTGLKRIFELQRMRELPQSVLRPNEDTKMS